MRKYILGIYFCLSSTIGFSQWYLGISEDSVIKEVTKKYKIKKEVDQNGIVCVNWKNEDKNSSYSVCFHKNISVVLIIVPLSSEATHAYVTTFNSNYVSVSDTEWNAYLSGNVYYIKMKYYTEGNGYAFSVVNKAKELK